jgi:phosphoenolpyruvate synthase/pyruvate phosphate dikinase
MEILWLGHPDCREVNRVGAKAANLSRLLAHSRIPPGFCVTVAAYAQWAEHASYQIETTTGEPTAISQSVPATLYSKLVAAYRDLADMCGVAEPSVAVRSSAVDEDGPTASFAGQYATYLNIVSVEAVAKAVGQCWASARTMRALEYCRSQGLAVEGVRLAVLIQQLVQADSSAVVFSANPVTGSRNHILINASWGLGESIVSGTVTPDAYVVRKDDLAIVERQITQKRRMTILSPEGTQEAAVPHQLQHTPAATDDQVREMAQLSMALEWAMGWAVDIECAYQGRELYLLQCRPITTLGAL